MGIFREFIGNIFYWIALIVVGVIVVFVMSYINKNNASDQDAFAFSVTSDEILSEFEENEVQANVKYQNEIVRIFGEIDSITGDSNEIVILLTDSILRYRVNLVFTDTSEIEQIFTLEPGDEIVVVGEVKELNNTLLTNILVFNKCNFIEEIEE